MTTITLFPCEIEVKTSMGFYDLNSLFKCDMRHDNSIPLWVKESMDYCGDKYPFGLFTDVEYNYIFTQLNEGYTKDGKMLGGFHVFTTPRLFYKYALWFVEQRKGRNERTWYTENIPANIPREFLR